jgi:CRISPR-associated endonuclease Csn1
VKGQTTSLLRHLWGLNGILNLEDDEMKNREDHRHHAIDAMVVALTSRGTLKTT